MGLFLLCRVMPEWFGHRNAKEKLMSLWGANSLPKNLTGAEKRNVVITSAGYVRRTAYTDQHNRERVKDVILVATGQGVLPTTNDKGYPHVTDAWSSNTTFTHGGTCNVIVSFSHGLTGGGLHGRIKMTVSNTAGGNAMLASSNGYPVTSNKLVFRWKPSKGGTYKVQAHLMSNGSATAANVRSETSGTKLANLYFTSYASNNLGSFTVYGQPVVSSITHSSNNITANSTNYVNTWITFTDPIESTGSGIWRLVVANTAGGNNVVATSDGTVYSSRRLRFRWKTPSTAGYYKVQAQTITNTATKTIRHPTTLELGSKVIGATASNTASPSKTIRTT